MAADHSPPTEGTHSFDADGITLGRHWAEEFLIPNSRLLVLEHSGHLGHLEEPEAFADSVAAFVSASR